LVPPNPGVILRIGNMKIASASLTW
jgi:hypothetical protein